MKNQKQFLLALWILTLPSLGLAALPKTETQLVDHDPFGIWQKKPQDFQQVTERGAKIVSLPQEKTFFTYWVPAHYHSGRIVVSVHGTGGNPYIAIRDEMEPAQKLDYLAVAVSWFSEERGFYPASDLYRNILEALDFIRTETGNNLSSVAYIGFSRGAAVSYEIAALDVKSENIFDFFISHSGGIPLDLRVEAKNPNSKPDPFFTQLTRGELGNQVFKGKKFFLYSGDKDESWGLTMSRQLENAKQLIEAGGGQVVEWVRDPNGGHTGLLKSPALREKATRYFIDSTANAHA